MKYSFLKFLCFFLLSFSILTGPPRKLFLGNKGLSTIVQSVVTTTITLVPGRGYSWLVLPETPQNPELDTIVTTLQQGNQVLLETRNSVLGLADQIETILQEMGLGDKMNEIKALWERMYHLLKAFNEGAYDGNDAGFKRNLDALINDIEDKVYTNVEWIERNAETYLDRIRNEMIQKQFDIVSYSVRLSYAIEDFLDHYCKAIELCNYAASESPYLASYAASIQGYAQDLGAYKKEYVQGRWLALVIYLLGPGAGDAAFFQDKVLQYYGTENNLIPLPASSMSLGMGSNNQVPLIIAPTDDAIIGNFPVNIKIDIDGTIKPLGASDNPPIVKFDFDKAGSEKWKLILCDNKAAISGDTTDYLCILNVATGLFLTLENKPYADIDTPESGPYSGLTVLKGFMGDNPYQVWTFGPIKRCCRVYQEANFQGSAFVEVCLNSTDTFKEYYTLPEGLNATASANCVAEVRLQLYEGVNYSGRELSIPSGTGIPAFDPATQVSQVKSFYVESMCNRIFIQPNMTGEYKTVCSDIAYLGEKFVGQNISIVIAGKSIQLFDQRDFVGNSIIIRRSMIDLLDWPSFVPRSVKFI